jgi:hypothetical protein
MAMGALKPSPLSRCAVSASIDSEDTSAMNCFGNSPRDIGHRRVPVPPARRTGQIFDVEPGCLAMKISG